MNQLYYGDNLQVLREHIADELVHLIYLYSAFNSKRDGQETFDSRMLAGNGVISPQVSRL
jgi:hypothetical protein